MNREEFDRFLDALLAAEPAEARDWEKLEYFPPHAPDAGAWEPRYFEGCLPIEVLARRGRDTLRFGPMKPVGLRDPRTGKTPWAVVQLRKENLRASSYNLVGFQNHLKFAEQARVLRLIPGLENARFLRFGQIHRNTYICAPALLDELLRLKCHPKMEIGVSGHDLSRAENAAESTEALAPEEAGRPILSASCAERVGGQQTLLFAGQLSGVEGYTESIASGLLAGIYAAALARGEELRPRPVPAPSAPWSTTLLTLTQKTFSRQHHLRPAGAARRRAAQEDSRQEGASSDRMRAGAGSLRCLVGANAVSFS